MSLLDHLVGSGEKHRGHRDTERLGRAHVQHELELGRLLDGQIRWLGAVHDLVHVAGCPSVKVLVVRPIRLPLWPSPKATFEAATLARNGSPLTTTNHPSDVLCPLPRRIKRVRVSITSSLMLHSPEGGS